MNAVHLLHKYFPNHYQRNIIVEHSRHAAAKALEIAGKVKESKPDLQFIDEASLLHDIGVCRTTFAGMNGNFQPYIRHGIIGREILENEGLPRHALVCERHIGVGLTVDDIRTQGLPLPERDMLPLTLEEKIVCLADLFFSKNPDQIGNEKTVEEVKKGLQKLGESKVRIFEGLLQELKLI